MQMLGTIHMYEQPTENIVTDPPQTPNNIAITVVAVILGLILIFGGFVSIPWVPSVFAEIYAWWYPYYGFAFSVCEIVSGFALFFRRKWVIYLQILNFIGNVVVLSILNSSIFNISFFVHIITIVFIAASWRFFK